VYLSFFFSGLPGFFFKATCLCTTEEVLKDYKSFKIVLDTTSTQILNILGYNLRKIPYEREIT
jgi:hypothetical protein